MKILGDLVASEAGCPINLLFLKKKIKSVDTVSRKAFKTACPQKESCLPLDEVCADVECI